MPCDVTVLKGQLFLTPKKYRLVDCLHSVCRLNRLRRFVLSLFQSASLLSDALAVHTAMAVAIANGGSQCAQRPPRCSAGGGPKFKLIHEGDIQVCRLNHSRTLISKVLSSKFLRRWEAHHVYLGEFQMYSATVSQNSQRICVELKYYIKNRARVSSARADDLLQTTVQPSAILSQYRLEELKRVLREVGLPQNTP